MDKESNFRKNTEDIRNEKLELIYKNNEEYNNISNDQNVLRQLRTDLKSYHDKIVGTGLKSNSDSFYQSNRQSYKLTEDGRYWLLT